MAFDSLYIAHDGGTPGAPLYTAEELRAFFRDLFTPGVISGFEVTERAAGANTTVDITAGVAYIEGPADFGPTSLYRVENDADTTDVAVGSAPGSNFRNDIIGVYQNDPDAPGSGDSTRVPEYDVITGAGHTPATTAGAAYGATGDPALPDRFIALARVRWSAGMVSITDAEIDDLRAYALLAGNYVDDANATQLGTSANTALALMRRSVDGTVAISDPTSASHAATKSYVDGVGTSAATASTIMRRSVDGQTAVADPTSDIHAATKGYVDGLFPVAESQIANNAVTTGKIAAGAVGTTDIADDAVTSAKVADAETNSVGGVTLRRVGNIVTAWGDFDGVTIPSGWRPVSEVRTPCNTANDGSSGYLAIQTNGTSSYVVHTGETDGGVAYATAQWATS